MSDHLSLELVLRGGGVSRGVLHHTGCRGNPDYDALIPIAARVDAVAQTAAAIGSRWWRGLPDLVLRSVRGSAKPRSLPCSHHGGEGQKSEREPKHGN